MKKSRILVVGSINMDLNIYGVPEHPEMGRSYPCNGYEYSCGGKGANQAVAVARLGAAAVMVGRVGQDENGSTILDNLKKYGVDTDCIIRDAQYPTGLATMNVDHSGRYYSFTILGSNNNIQPADIEKALAEQIYDRVLMQLEMPLECVYKTYELASAKNIPVFLDAGPAMQIPLDRLKGIEIISPNEVETKALTGIEPDSEESALLAAKKLYEMVTPKYVVLKLGSQGALLYDGVQSHMMPAFRVNAVDSTAAGDTFSAALAIQLCQGRDILEAIRFANAAAGICVSRKGAQESVPSQEEVEEFLQKQ